MVPTPASSSATIAAVPRATSDKHAFLNTYIIQLESRPLEVVWNLVEAKRPRTPTSKLEHWILDEHITDSSPVSIFNVVMSTHRFKLLPICP